MVAHPGHVQLEDLFSAGGFEYAFLDLRRRAPGGEWLRWPIVAAPIGNRPALEVWPDYFDGLFFIEEEWPAHLAEAS